MSILRVSECRTRRYVNWGALRGWWAWSSVEMELLDV